MSDDNGSFLLALFEFFLFFAWLTCLLWVLSDIFRSNILGGGAGGLGRVTGATAARATPDRPLWAITSSPSIPKVHLPGVWCGETLRTSS